jgi:hypothetical protein
MTTTAHLDLEPPDDIAGCHPVVRSVESWSSCAADDVMFAR